MGPTIKSALPSPPLNHVSKSTSTLFLKTPRDGDTTASICTLFWCLTVKKFFLISNLDLSWHNLYRTQTVQVFPVSFLTMCSSSLHKLEPVACVHQWHMVKGESGQMGAGETWEPDPVFIESWNVKRLKWTSQIILPNSSAVGRDISC